MFKTYVFWSFLLILLPFMYYDNNRLGITNYNIYFKNLPIEFDGFRILQISDLHNKSFGNKNERLVNDIIFQKPDIIVITGDFIDRRKNDVNKAIELIEKIKSIAPIYYVTGNHEWDSGKMDELISRLKNEGVFVLQDENATIKRSGASIEVVGLDDIEKYGGPKNREELLSKSLDKAVRKSDDNLFTVLLAHRPEFIKVYASKKIDLVMSGHAHGGVIRLPFIGPLYTHGKGKARKYTEGVRDYEGTKIVISRGLGNTTLPDFIPQRLFNSPEIVLLTLHK